jgi:uncharacterized protein (DUF2336 family)
MSAHATHIPELDELILRGSRERQAETLERVTAFFLDGASRFNEDHVQLFDLVFTRLLDHIESAARSALSCRLAPLGNAPAAAVRRLAHDDSIAVAGPVLKQARRLSETDLIDIVQNKSQAHLLAISTRGHLAEPVTDVLVRHGDQDVLRSLAENRGACLSRDGFCVLTERAKTDAVLAEKIVLRPDVPPRLLHELLLTATGAMQRRLIPRAAAERRSEVGQVSAKVSSETVGPIEVRDYSRAQRRVEALHREGKLDEARLVTFAENGEYEPTIAALASLCAVPIEVAHQLMGAEQPDPVLILCKSAGWAWTTTAAILKVRPCSARASSEHFDTARADFDRLSATTARRVVRFWQVRSDDRPRTTDDGQG